MKLLFVMQAGVLVALLVRGLRMIETLSSDACVDERLVARLMVAVERGEPDALAALELNAPGAWVSQVLSASHSLEDTPSDRLAEIRSGFRARLYVLTGIGRMASVAMMMAVIIELSWGLSGGSGLQALQAGLPQQIAFRDVLTSLAIGFVTLAFYIWIRSILLRRFTAATGALLRLARALRSECDTSS